MANKLTKTYPEIAELSKFHLDLAKEIDKMKPGWLGYAGVKESQGEKYLELRVPSTSGDKVIIITTEGYRLSIYFDRWHTHYYLWDGMKVAVKRLFDHVQAIMDEKLIVVVQSYEKRVRPDRNKTSQQTSFGIYPLEQIKEIPTDHLLYTCSWDGTYDKVYREFDIPWIYT